MGKRLAEYKEEELAKADGVVMLPESKPDAHRLHGAFPTSHGSTDECSPNFLITGEKHMSPLYRMVTT